MNEKSGIGWSNPVIILAGVTLLATLVTAGLVLFGQPVAAAIIGTATVFFWLALLVVTTAAVVSWWSATLMQRGAEIALTAQVSDDKRDIAQITAVGNLARILWRQVQPDRLALPLPSQEADSWLPEVASFDMGDVVNGEIEKHEPGQVVGTGDGMGAARQ